MDEACSILLSLLSWVTWILTGLARFSVLFAVSLRNYLSRAD